MHEDDRPTADNEHGSSIAHLWFDNVGQTAALTDDANAIFNSWTNGDFTSVFCVSFS